MCITMEGEDDLVEPHFCDLNMSGYSDKLGKFALDSTLDAGLTVGCAAEVSYFASEWLWMPGGRDKRVMLNILTI